MGILLNKITMGPGTKRIWLWATCGHGLYVHMPNLVVCPWV